MALSYYAREKDGVSLFELSAEFKESNSSLPRLFATSVEFSSDGSLICIITSGDLKVITLDGKEILKIIGQSVVAASLSPKNTYLQVLTKPNGQEKNLSIRRVENGETVLEQYQKGYSKQEWPSIQFSEDEALACRCMTNEVQIYDSSNWNAGISQRVRAPNLGGALLSFDPPSHLAIFVKESKGAPAGVRIFPLPSKPDSQPCARRSFFKANSCRMMWNRGSTAVLALSHADVDKTNKSYYGESNLHFISTDASFEGSVPLSKEGPIHDVQWSPSGKEFVVVYGFMPSKATLFNSRCKPLFDFGSGPRNCVRWNPFDRYICLAGFGNLPGDVEIWDRQSLTKLGSTRASNGVSIEWSPQGLHLLVSTTAPRLQVDNGIRVYACDATLVYQKSYSTLFSADWKPFPRGTFSDAPFVQGSAKAISSTSTTSSSSSAKPKATSAYRPPQARGAAGASFVKSQLSGASDKPKVIGSGAMIHSAGESKNAAKNRKKKEKEKEEKDKVVPSDSKPVEEAVKLMSELKPPSSDDLKVEKTKKLRALQKKLRQIDELKKKAAEGSVLTSEQKEKLKSEGGINKEIESLEKSLSEI